MMCTTSMPAWCVRGLRVCSEDNGTKPMMDRHPVAASNSTQDLHPRFVGCWLPWISHTGDRPCSLGIMQRGRASQRALRATSTLAGCVRGVHVCSEESYFKNLII